MQPVPSIAADGGQVENISIAPPNDLFLMSGPLRAGCSVCVLRSLARSPIDNPALGPPRRLQENRRLVPDLPDNVFSLSHHPLRHKSHRNGEVGITHPTVPNRFGPARRHVVCPPNLRIFLFSRNRFSIGSNPGLLVEKIPMKGQKFQEPKRVGCN